jgi:hypothetical protein
LHAIPIAWDINPNRTSILISKPQNLSTKTHINNERERARELVLRSTLVLVALSSVQHVWLRKGGGGGNEQGKSRERERERASLWGLDFLVVDLFLLVWDVVVVADVGFVVVGLFLPAWGVVVVVGVG